MNYEQIFFYYKSKEIFDFDKTIALLEKFNFFIKNSETQLITVLQKDSDSVIEREKLQEFFMNHEFFSIYLWISSIDCIIWSFGYEENIFSHIFDVTHLRFNQVEHTSKFFLNYALNELNKSNHNFLEFAMDLNGSTYEYDFDYFFYSHEEKLPTKYIPDILIIAKDKLKQVILNENLNPVKVNTDYVFIAKNQKLSNYLESLL